jgi:hypothetical protein
MPVPQPTSTVLRRGAVGLLVGGVIRCVVLLREREDGPWLLFVTVITETAVVWDRDVSAARYGTDSPTGDADDTPNATLQPDGSLVLR